MNPTSFRFSSICGVEPLESRIAPARVIIVGGPDFPNKSDINYDDPSGLFVNTEANGADPISAAVGPGDVDSADTFYLRLGSGDVLKIFNTSNNAEEFLTVKSGNVVAFFVDKNLNNEVEEGELVSLSLGKDTSIILRSALEGDVVTNLDEKNSSSLFDDTITMTGLVSSKQGIKSLTIGGGAVGGNILAGGNITDVIVNGAVNAVLAGSAANGATFDLLPGKPGGSATIAFQTDPGVAGSSISRISLDEVVDRVEAGGGGAGAAGGSLSQIKISEDTDGFKLLAGQGGDGSGAKKNGGAGGSVSDIYIAGNTDGTPNSLIEIAAGVGGNSLVFGSGGAGGSATKVYVGFQLAGTVPIPSDSLLTDNVSIHSGAGGEGKTGGKAGSLTTISVLVSTNDDPDPVIDEISLIAGAGGNSNDPAGGKTGIGGSITSVNLQNRALTTGGIALPGVGADILLQAGNGGVANGLGTSSAGGSITNAVLLGSDHRVLAGNGSSGKTGGAGGTLKDIVVMEGEDILAHYATFRAGSGGNAGKGNGGKGGDVNGVRVDNGDFAVLEINPDGGGNGGEGKEGKGGNGGLVANIDIFEIDSGVAPQFEGTFLLNSGNGGIGTKGGGVGGAVNVVRFDGEDLNLVVTSGTGGSTQDIGATLGKGKGAAGGVLSNLELIGRGDVLSEAVSAMVTSGAGGNGKGTSGAGGTGADLKSVGVRVAGSATVIAGNGGSGDGGAAGKGGNINSSGIIATTGDGRLQAGDGGLNGAKAGLGGSILGGSSDRLTGLYAFGEVEILAGNGTHGGAGGSIKYVGYGSTFDELTPTPAGNITVQAGNGSAQGKVAGAGGSIDNVAGSVSSSAETITRITAGVGGGIDGKSAAGGSVSNISISRGGVLGAELKIDAGDAGDGGSGVSTGAKGGNVTGVAISNIDPATTIRHIAAGAGGDATKKGGLGGSINDVHTLNHDIGVRSGLVYGYDSMGGLFAGAGGNASLAGAPGKGLAGSVTNVSASAIAVIVAGKGPAPEAVTKVDFIQVGPDTDLLKDSEGDLDHSVAVIEAGFFAFVAESFATNNLVGAVVNPTAGDGTKFHFIDTNGNNIYDFDLGEVPIDGLIVAKEVIQKNMTFTPEARVVGGVFYDYNNLV